MIRAEISEAMEALLGLPANKIKVMKRAVKERQWIAEYRQKWVLVFTEERITAVYFKPGIIEWKYESMGKKEFCDETDLQKESDHYHDTGSHDCGGGIPELLVEEGSGGGRGVRGGDDGYFRFGHSGGESGEEWGG